MPKSFPFTKQLDEMDCGAACLQMVAQYHKRRFPLSYLKELVNQHQEGVSLLDISEGAEQIGMRTLAARLTFKQLRDDVPLPCIVFWEGYHFVVVYEVTDQMVTVGNPAADGILKLSVEDFLFGWTDNEESELPTGIGLVLETTPEFFEYEEERQERSMISYIWGHLQKFQGLIWQILGGLLVVGILQFTVPFLIKAMVDVGITYEDRNFIWLVLGGLVVFLISQLFVEFLRGVLVNHIGTHLNMRMLTDYVIKVIQQPISFFSAHSIGDLVQRVGDHERLEKFIHSSALFYLFSSFNFVIFSLIFLSFSWKLFLMFFIGTTLHVVWIRIFLKRRRELNFIRFEQSALSHNYLVDIFQGIEDIKLFNAERQRRWAWEKIQSKLFRLDMKASRLELWQSRGAFFIHELKNILILVIAALAVLDGEMTIGMMLATMYILGQLSAPIHYLVEFFQRLQEATIGLERIGEIQLALPEDNGENKINLLPAGGDLTLENVSFRYGGVSSPLVLKNMNLLVPKGKVTAIVGSSGSGKTTLMKVLIGMLTPNVGTVKVGDVVQSAIKSSLWLNQVAAVLDDGRIFHDTIARNIALGVESIQRERLLLAAKVANLQPYVDSQPLHFNTVVGEGGVGLSKGLQQRLLIARAVYKNPEYLFLDDATNALDAYNEMVVLENLRELFEDKTIIIVAHRLSTISHADQIILIEDGEILEVGKHADLYDKKGAYYHMVRRQLELGA